MNRPIVVITRPIPEPATSLLAKRFSVRAQSKDRVLTPKELARFVRGASAILSVIPDHIDGTIMDAAGPQLKIVANYAVGFDNIDLDAAKARDVIVTNTPGPISDAVAEHTIALMLAVSRRIVEADQFARAGKYTQWEPMGFIGPQLLGKTLGIIGLGRIGTVVAEIAHRGYGMEILYHDLYQNKKFEAHVAAHYLSLPVLLRRSDIVTIHVPLLPSTRHLIDTPELKLMKKTAILINTSRGPIVHEDALAKALRDQTIWGAGIDVFEHEPKITPALVKLSNIVITPHIASATLEARTAMSRIAAENIIHVLSGKKAANPVF